MTYGSDAASTHLSNAYWYLDTGDMHPVDPSAENMTAMTNRESPFVGTGLARVGKYSYLVDNIVTYLTCPVPLYLLPDVRLQIRLNKTRPSFYLMKKRVDSKTVFKFLDAQLRVRCVRPNPPYCSFTTRH